MLSLFTKRTNIFPLLATIATSLAFYLYLNSNRKPSPNTAQHIAEQIIKMKQKLATRTLLQQDIKQIVTIAKLLSMDKMKQKIRASLEDRKRICLKLKSQMGVKEMGEYMELLRDGMEQIWMSGHQQIIRVGQIIGLEKGWLKQHKETIQRHFSETVSECYPKLSSDMYKREIRKQIKFIRQYGEQYTKAMVEGTKEWGKEQKGSLRALLPIMFADLAAIQDEDSIECFGAHYANILYRMQLSCELEQLQISTSPLILQINRQIHRNCGDEIQFVGDRQELEELQREQLQNYGQIGRMIEDKGITL